MTPVAGNRLGHYRLLEKLGEGGMGVVWKAHDDRLDRLVALKIPSATLSGDSRFLARLEREAQSAAALAHPNIVTIYSVERDGPAVFFTMELVEGRPLSDLIPEGGLPLPRFLELAVPLVDAVAAAHARGIVHRDLKPANVMVTAEGRIKVLDFGLARRGPAPEPTPAPAAAPAPAPPRSATAAAFAETRLPDTTRLEGTPLYMAPEQFVHGLHGDERSDLYALGVILYEMATGRRPFGAPGAPAREVTHAMLHDAPPLATDLRNDFPRPLARLLRQCLEADPARRLASAAALRDELAGARLALGSGRPVPAQSLAVLPFHDLSEGRDQAHLCEGLAEELLHALARAGSLRVASRTSSFRFAGSHRSSREIGLELGVGSLLEGSLRVDGDDLRLSVSLSDVATDTVLWSVRLSRPRRDAFALPGEVARGVLAALAVEPAAGAGTGAGNGAGAGVALRPAPPVDPETYELYLRGRQFFVRYSRRNILFALDLFERAAARDPSFAPAHAGIGDCYSFLSLYVDRSEENRRGAEEASRRALELDPGLAQAHASRGLALSLGARHAEAEAEFEAAERLDPWLFEAAYFHARDAFAQGKLEEAARLYERATVLRPEDYQAPLLVAQVYEELGRPADATVARRRGLDAAERHLATHPDDVRAIYMAANAMAALGETARALAWADRALTLDPDDSMVLYNVACIRALAGQVDTALDALEKSVRAGLIHREWIEHDGNLAPLRAQPRFVTLLARLRNA